MTVADEEDQAAKNLTVVVDDVSFDSEGTAGSGLPAERNPIEPHPQPQLLCTSAVAT